MVDIGATSPGGWVTRFVLSGGVVAEATTSIIGMSVLGMAVDVGWSAAGSVDRTVGLCKRVQRLNARSIGRP
jgi:hypothetical protein